MKQVNELASQQDERNSKLATENQKKAKVYACEVPKEGGEQRTRKSSADGSQQILSGFRQITAPDNDPKSRVNA